MEAIKLTTAPTFESIRNFFSNNERKEILFSYQEKTVIGQRKFTQIGNIVKTNFLRIAIEHKEYIKGKKTFHVYREDKKGNFNFIGYMERSL